MLTKRKNELDSKGKSMVSKIKDLLFCKKYMISKV